ncbi:hypothetical protein MCOR02_010038 [Pyricularia oryzae]|nr:hypothetical protein MCOR02_010038 [Pyricularia oryzae]
MRRPSWFQIYTHSVQLIFARVVEPPNCDPTEYHSQPRIISRNGGGLKGGGTK